MSSDFSFLTPPKFNRLSTKQTLIPIIEKFLDKESVLVKHNKSGKRILNHHIRVLHRDFNKNCKSEFQKVLPNIESVSRYAFNLGIQPRHCLTRDAHFFNCP
eukprot:1061755_1